MRGGYLPASIKECSFLLAGANPIANFQHRTNTLLARKRFMSYGHRLNLEEVFFALAESKFAEATASKGKVQHRNPETDADESFVGYPSEEGLAAISIAIVSWATSLEAFTNLVWNEVLSPRIPEGTIRSLAIKQLSTVEKLKELFGVFSLEVGGVVWWPHIRQLFEIRNRLVHFKDEVVYQGFCFADPTRRSLNEDVVLRLRESVISCITALGRLSGARTDFTHGDYEFETVSA